MTFTNTEFFKLANKLVAWTFSHTEVIKKKVKLRKKPSPLRLIT